MLRSIVSKALFPTLEKDLANSLKKEVRVMDDIMGSMLAPQVHSYQSASATTTGAFGASIARSSPERLVRVARPVKTNGLFHE